jgi:hypothetical protein
VPVTLLVLAAIPLACGFRVPAAVLGLAAVVAVCVTNAAAAQSDAAAVVEDGVGFVAGVVAIVLIFYPTLDWSLAVGDRPVYVQFQRAPL